MSSWIGTLQRLAADITPWFLRGKNQGAFNESVGLVLDNAVDTLRTGLELGQPLRCDASALPYLARDRKVTLYPSEPDASKRYRLSRWLQLARYRGTHYGEMLNVQPYFLPGNLPTIRIVHQAGDGSSATWHTLNPDGTYVVQRPGFSNWNWDNVPSAWSRWWVIFYIGGTTLDTGVTDWDDGSLWNGGQLWDGSPAANQIVDLVAALRERKAAHSQLWGVIFTRDPAALDPMGSAVANPDGSTTYPQGNWWHFVNEVTGKPTRPSNIEVVYNLGHA